MSDRKPTAIRRTEIADAALHVVATQGIAALSTRVLADAVGLTTGALFKHFSCREALFVGMAERAAALLRTTMPDEALPAAERIHRFTAARLALVSGRSGVFELVLSEQFSLALPDQATAVLRKAVADTHAFLTRAVAEGQHDGTLRDDVPADGLALLFMGAMQVTAFARRTGAVGMSALDVLNHLTNSPKEFP